MLGWHHASGGISWSLGQNNEASTDFDFAHSSEAAPIILIPFYPRPTPRQAAGHPTQKHESRKR
jgi:hypothetical protein